ncbi:MAG TPA: aspartate/glutamate racemase family protein [Candidatus Angelobacter sp.]
MSYPQEVELNLAFFRTHSLWHIVSENPAVRSCPDAAQRRNRLGNEGIPLFDELKTSVGLCDSPLGRRYIAVHCRGHQLLDERKLATVLGCPFARLAEEELTEQFSAEKGLVNPFGLAQRADVQQIFDKTVLDSYFPPNTMMTNLGHLCYAVEFHASEVVEALDATVADLVQEQGTHVPKVHSLGILTGNGPESGILLWQLINAHIRNHSSKIFRGDYSFPSVFVESLPGMGLTMELRERERDVRPIVLEGVRRLCDRGATVVGVACNTTQYFADEIAEVCEKNGAQFVRMAEETASYLRRQGIKTFDFIGIGAVLDFAGWSGFGKALSDFDIKTPSEESRLRIGQLAYKVKNEVVTGRTITKLRDLINETQTEVVVVALTELSILLADQKAKKRSQKHFVDTLEILAEKMADIYIQGYVVQLQIANEKLSLAQSA